MESVLPTGGLQICHRAQVSRCGWTAMPFVSPVTCGGLGSGREPVLFFLWMLLCFVLGCSWSLPGFVRTERTCWLHFGQGLWVMGWFPLSCWWYLSGSGGSLTGLPSPAEALCPQACCHPCLATVFPRYRLLSFCSVAGVPSGRGWGCQGAHLCLPLIPGSSDLKAIAQSHQLPS